MLKGVVDFGRYLFVGTSPLRIAVRVLSSSHNSSSHDGTEHLSWRHYSGLTCDTLAGGDGDIVAYCELVGELRTLSLVAAPTVVVLRITGACIQPVAVPKA